MAPKPEPDRLLFVFGMRDLIGCRAGTTKTKGRNLMFGSLARFALVFAGLAFVIPDTLGYPEQ